MNFIENLYLIYQQREHFSVVKDKKRKLSLDNKPPLSRLELTNIRLKTAVDSGLPTYTKAALSKMFSLKPSQITKSSLKKKQGKEYLLQKRGRRTNIKPEYLEFIINYLNNQANRFNSLETIKAKLIEKFVLSKKEFCLQTVHNMIKLTYFHYKRVQIAPIERNSEEIKEKRVQLIEEIIRHIQLGRTFIYLDETGFNSRLSPLYGYAFRSQRCIFTHSKEPKIIL